MGLFHRYYVADELTLCFSLEDPSRKLTMAIFGREARRAQGRNEDGRRFGLRLRLRLRLRGRGRGMVKVWLMPMLKHAWADMTSTASACDYIPTQAPVGTRLGVCPKSFVGGLVVLKFEYNDTSPA